MFCYIRINGIAFELTGVHFNICACRYSTSNLGFYVNVDCKGNEASIANCTVTRNPLCNQLTTAGVSCNRGKIFSICRYCQVYSVFIVYQVF